MEVLLHCKASGSTFCFGIYEAIQRKCWHSTNPVADRVQVKYENVCYQLYRVFGLLEHSRFVHGNDLIPVPSYLGRPPTWMYPAHCVLDGPAYLTRKSPLLPALSAVNNTILTSFFRDTLRIYLNLIDELVEIKDKSLLDLINVRDIWHGLQNMAPDLSLRELEDFR